MIKEHEQAVKILESFIDRFHKNIEQAGRLKKQGGVIKVMFGSLYYKPV